MSARTSRPTRRLVVAIAIASAVVLTGCTANEDLAEQYRSERNRRGRSFMYTIIFVGTRTIFIECQEMVFHQGDRQRCWRSLGKSDFRDLLTIDHGPTRE